MISLSCEEVWRQISDYIDDDVTPGTRRMLEAHFAQCRHCAALVDSVHNVVVLVADERVFTLPAGFSERLRQRLAVEVSGKAPEDQR
jgi:anti-sigma factor RsiW